MKPPPLCKNKYVSYFKYQTTHENSYMGVMKKVKQTLAISFFHLIIINIYCHVKRMIMIFFYWQHALNILKNDGNQIQTRQGHILFPSVFKRKMIYQQFSINIMLFHFKFHLGLANNCIQQVGVDLEPSQLTFKKIILVVIIWFSKCLIF